MNAYQPPPHVVPSSVRRPTDRESLLVELSAREILPFIGVYDAFSASIAGRSFDSVFLSGFGLAASQFGLPDVGFVTWQGMLDFAQRVRAVLPDHFILVDIDDGYGDKAVAAHMVQRLSAVGVSGVVLEDQKRPRSCGHLNGKQLLEVDDYCDKLAEVMRVRDDLLVVARTDASQPAEILSRAVAFAEVGADAILADGIDDLELVRELADTVKKPVVYNMIAGGKSPDCTLSDLRNAGVSLAIYSTPCLFAAQGAIHESLSQLVDSGGRLSAANRDDIKLDVCHRILVANQQGG